MGYFEKLNYTLANEDTRVEADLLGTRVKSVFTICGSGARVLPLLARNPEAIEIVDLSDAQLKLCELRIEAARQLDYGDFLFFLGYRNTRQTGLDPAQERAKMFLKLELSQGCRDFWRESQALWAPRGWILLGNWEAHFQKIGMMFRRTFRADFSPIFEAKSLDEQIKRYDEFWRPRLFRFFLRVVASETVFNRILYKGNFSGRTKKKTERRPPWKFIDDEFRRVFTTQLVRESFFFQILFLGEVRFEEGLPLEATPQAVEGVKRAQSKITYRLGSLMELVRERPHDFYSLSDTISYLPDEDVSRLLQVVHADVRPGAIAVIRSFLSAPALLNERGWEEDSEANAKAHARDVTGVYSFHIFRKAQDKPA